MAGIPRALRFNRDASWRTKVLKCSLRSNDHLALRIHRTPQTPHNGATCFAGTGRQSLSTHQVFVETLEPLRCLGTKVSTCFLFPCAVRTSLVRLICKHALVNGDDLDRSITPEYAPFSCL